MSAVLSIGGYDLHILAQGFPGKSHENGGLGWSTVALLQGNGRTILVDTGSFSIRRTLLQRLSGLGLKPADISHVLLTHLHYDHMMNWTLFPNAQVLASKPEMDWALADPIEGSLCAELYVRELASSPQLTFFAPGEEPLPGIRSLAAPGHTPHHVVFRIDEGQRRLLLAADAVKNRAEFLSERAVSTLDQEESDASIRKVKKLWLERPGAVLLCGHDLPFVNREGHPDYLGERRAGITAWFDEDITRTEEFHLRPR